MGNSRGRTGMRAGEQVRRDRPGLDGHAGVAVVGCVRGMKQVQ